MVPKRKKGWDKNQQVNEEVNKEVNEEVNNYTMLLNYDNSVLNNLDIKVPVFNTNRLIRIYYNRVNKVRNIAWLEEHQAYNEENDVEEYYYEDTSFTINALLKIHLLDINDLVTPSEDNDVDGEFYYTELLVNLAKAEYQVNDIALDMEFIIASRYYPIGE